MFVFGIPFWLLSIICLPAMSQAQEDMPISVFLDEIMNPENRSRTLTYTNKNFINDLAGLQVNQYLKQNFEDVSITKGLVDISKNLKINNCRFGSGLYLDSLNFKALQINNSDAAIIRIQNCSFSVLYISETKSPNIELKSLTIDKALTLKESRATKILLRDLNTNGNISLGDNQVGTIEVYNSTFNFPSEGFFKNYRFNEVESIDLIMIENTFNGDSASNVELQYNYTNLIVEDNQFDVDFYLLRSSVKERFIMVNNEFHKRVSFENFIFSETKNELYWDQFEGYKLAYSKNGQIFAAMTPEGFQDEVKFKNLIATYKEMHRIFLGRGDLESANACYNEMKELQGLRHKYIYDTEGGFNNLFRWILNRLLKIYTNHGTDPALAVVISFYVILTFAVFYFFFPSEWDKESKMNLIKDYRLQVKENKGHKPKSFLILVGILFLSLLNAITLSLNAFVTLGFGTIPTTGVARYLCIVQGFLGWFLLSIFTVALINQVLA